MTNAAFTVLGMVFNYPDILGEPVDDILAAFRANQTTVVVWFTVMALSAALFAPIAIGVGRLSTHRAMRIAVPVGIAAAVVQVIGLARWPLLVPGFAPMRPVVIRPSLLGPVTRFCWPIASSAPSWAKPSATC